MGRNTHANADCRAPWCDDDAQGAGNEYSRFCSPQCGVTFEKRRDDAREARLAAERPADGHLGE